MNTDEFIEKVRGLVLNNAELNKTVTDFVREHPECWIASKYDRKSKITALRIEINFHTNAEQIKEARPWFCIDFGYSDAELTHSETLHENHDDPGEYRCYIDQSDKSFILKDKVNWIK